MEKLNTADTWDSYEPYLIKAVYSLRPKRVFEWGGGKSTRTFLSFFFVESVDTVEHDPSWAKRIADKDHRLNVIFEGERSLYPFIDGRHGKYDFIMVDGVEREKCLFQAQNMLNEHGVVILHDAERPEYQEAIKDYPHQIWVDDGHTVFLTFNETIAGIIDANCLPSS